MLPTVISAGLHLKDAKDLSSPGAPLKDNLTIHAANIATVAADSANNVNRNESNCKSTRLLAVCCRRKKMHRHSLHMHRVIAT